MVSKFGKASKSSRRPEYSSPLFVCYPLMVSSKKINYRGISDWVLDGGFKSSTFSGTFIVLLFPSTFSSPLDFVSHTNLPFIIIYEQV